ncbi:MAG: succinyl-diaminopimelate desuccinylase [Holosporales bacterium]|jgi:succinyl-diaminopimelate desuccinylase|nr:succinyl-diaminopimelate desuccinylase [Holosporales bacterium]
MNDTAKLLSTLIKMPHVEDVINFLYKQFISLGFNAEILSFHGIHNLYAHKNVNDCTAQQEAANNSKILLFLGHADVVPIGASQKHPAGTLINDNIWGRGAVDMKGSISCCMSALRQNSDVSIAVIISGDEEGSAEFGTPAVLNLLRSQKRLPVFDFVLIGEPTSYEEIGDHIKIGCRGSMNVSISAEGVSGHVAYPAYCINPVTKLVELVYELNLLAQTSGHYNIEVFSIYSNSGATNVVPSWAKCCFNIRFDENISANELINIIETISGKQNNIQWHFTYDVACQPFMSRPDPLFDILINATMQVTRQQPQVSSKGANSDAKFIKDIAPFAELGLKTCDAHKIDEKVSLQDLYTLTKIYDQFLQNWQNAT